MSFAVEKRMAAGTNRNDSVLSALSKVHPVLNDTAASF
jgi:hypothetical protein